LLFLCWKLLSRKEGRGRNKEAGVKELGAKTEF
jgi:hypothetical protein